MIPDSPTWASINKGTTYPKPDFDEPVVHSGLLIYDVNVGPTTLNKSNGRLNTRYWLAHQVESGDVVLKGANGNGWGEGTTLFNSQDGIAEISLTFDQLGRPIVFFRINEDDIKLYWYNPVTEVSEVKDLGKGNYPNARFDVIDNSGVQYSDAMLFYVRDDTIYMRVQRDRYDVEYVTPATGRNMRILSSGINVNNRFQVSYKYEVDKPEEL